MTENKNNNPTQINETPLESWKEIAAYLKRDVRTVIRWEKKERLPVRRHLHQARSSVYAYPSELEAWKAARQPGFDQAPLAMPWRRPLPALGFAVTLLLALISVASGPILTPPGALAQESGGMVARQVWAGPETEIWHTALTSDGRYYTYVDWSTGDLALRDLTTGEKRRLTNKGSWNESGEFALSSVISPDDRQVAYVWFNEELFYELRLLELDGSKPRVLYRNPELEYIDVFDWSPDGKQIVGLFSPPNKMNQIVLFNVADGSVKVLKTLDWRYPGGISLSPDGRYVVYGFAPQEDSNAHDIFVLSTDGSREIPLVQHPANDVRPIWAPDGNRIVFASDRRGTMDAWVIQVADGKPRGSPKLLKQGLGRSVPLRFTRNGSYYYGLQTGMKDVYLATLDPATGKLQGEPTRVTQRFLGSNRSPDWSPDGEYLAYVSARNALAGGGGFGNMTIVIRSVGTGEERELSPGVQSPRLHPRWSPDGRFLLIKGKDAKGREGLFRIEVQSGEVSPIRPIESGAYVRWETWSADGRAIYFTLVKQATKKMSLVVRDLETGGEKELYRADYIASAALSPDGRQLALVTPGPAPRSEVLLVLLTAGGEARELLRVREPEVISGAFNMLTWTTDGRGILFGKTQASMTEPKVELWRIPAEGGRARKVGLAMDELRELSCHPDGRRIAFGAGRDRGEVWVLENFLPKPEAKAARLEE